MNFVIQMKHSPFFVCRVLAAKPGKRDYVVFREPELNRRHDVEVAAKGFPTKAAAEAEIRRLGGTSRMVRQCFLIFSRKILQRFGAGKMSAL
jgi:hypothetical protein